MRTAITLDCTVELDHTPQTTLSNAQSRFTSAQSTVEHSVYSTVYTVTAQSTLYTPLVEHTVYSTEEHTVEHTEMGRESI